MAVAAAMGIKVEPAGGGKLDYYRFLDGSSFTSNLKRNLIDPYHRIQSTAE